MSIIWLWYDIFEMIWLRYVMKWYDYEILLICYANVMTCVMMWRVDDNICYGVTRLTIQNML